MKHPMGFRDIVDNRLKHFSSNNFDDPNTAMIIECRLSQRPSFIQINQVESVYLFHRVVFMLCKNNLLTLERLCSCGDYFDKVDDMTG